MPPAFFHSAECLGSLPDDACDSGVVRARGRRKGGNQKSRAARNQATGNGSSFSFSSRPCHPVAPLVAPPSTTPPGPPPPPRRGHTRARRRPAPLSLSRPINLSRRRPSSETRTRPPRRPACPARTHC
eukprot:362713-Chlamydomonas_euryale.AAC.2